MDLKVGKKIWVAVDSIPTEVTIRFIGDKEVAYEMNGNLETKSTKNIFETEAACNASIKGLLITAFCREVSRLSGEVMVYPIERDLDSELLTVLRYRGRMNPELIYGVCMKSFFSEHKDEMRDLEALNQMHENNNVVLL